jgi:hypothetical protein
MFKVLTLKFRDGGLYGITDPDLNIDIAENGTMPAIEHEAWERLTDETKFRHERRKINILMKLLADYESAIPGVITADTRLVLRDLDAQPGVFLGAPVYSSKEPCAHHTGDDA